MKEKSILIRVSGDEMERITKLGGENRSEWIRAKLLSRDSLDAPKAMMDAWTAWAALQQKTFPEWACEMLELAMAHQKKKQEKSLTPQA
ncbi:MAG: hypothetical protein K1Y02_26045 [Candidatus Hydrogenedentes bacterium]|nr:hypothetical protein [Candidatus Hydrogenedentota bacterium]